MIGPLRESAPIGARITRAVFPRFLSVKRIVVVAAGCMLTASCATKGPPPDAPSTGPVPSGPTSPIDQPSPRPPPSGGAAPTRPEGPLPNSPAAKAIAQNLVRQAFELLDKGEEESARAQLEKAVALDTENKSAACLLRGIRADPAATLGRDFTSYTVRAGDTLGSIAKRALGDICEFYLLARYNQIRVPRLLAAGNVIRLPGKTPLPTMESVPAARKSPALDAVPTGPATPPSPPLQPTAAEPNPPSAAPSEEPSRIAIERHHRNASAAFRRQDLETAIKEWDKVLELDPGNDFARARRQEAMELDRRIKQISK
jgi:hypothetical protein